MVILPDDLIGFAYIHRILNKLLFLLFQNPIVEVDVFSVRKPNHFNVGGEKRNAANNIRLLSFETNCYFYTGGLSSYKS